MQAYVQTYADVISHVTGIDVEIMDSAMLRIAGTGVYAPGVGSSMEQAGEVYKEVMLAHETILVDSPRHHRVCFRCPDRDNCQERCSLATPIADGDTLYGVIGLVCFNDADRRRVLDSVDSYTAFISFLADALARKVEEQNRLDRVSRFLDLMLQVVDVPGQGIMLFDENGRLTYCNTPARALFGLPADARMDLGAVQCSGQGLYGFEEFEVRAPDGRRHSLQGRLQKLDAGPHAKATLFVFELPSRLAQFVGDLSAGGTPAGFDNLIGRSQAIGKLKDRAMKVADSNSTVLITGESGTGKELLARAIHQASPRRDFPFIAINCGSIPDTLLESELFGYVGGAFTGASNKGRMGKFELAGGGVIFLDEISSIPLYMQVKLLRVLQERVVVRLGSNRPVHVDVRVIAATNENLQDCIRRNAFREDLYYRLNVIPLDIPPLRERAGDVAILADFFLDKYCSLFQKRKPRLRAPLLRMLEGYAWPGNVRELEHVMEYAVNMMPESGALGLDCLPSQLLENIREGRGDGGAPPAALRDEPPPAAPPEVEPLRALEERAIRAALDRYGRSTEGKRQAARALGLGLATLYRKMAAFSL
ncbi:sigma 54-interacting transcriptional regulator [Desulfocurvus sp.]|uniref:sigma-54 interaction domain-containing protein n=1 Tax=Desulfocurvus sp. TaxID=2871698 RepID=UPI0025BC4655|nr:sigma 54-interacting transcriptional regulator [Desulfocurvus sp.]MCK9240339.1 sigma 54-interacting transcriptional regulator [Desulfocurvus sp.]